MKLVGRIQSIGKDHMISAKEGIGRAWLHALLAILLFCYSRHVVEVEVELGGYVVDLAGAVGMGNMEPHAFRLNRPQRDPSSSASP